MHVNFFPLEMPKLRAPIACLQIILFFQLILFRLATTNTHLPGRFVKRMTLEEFKICLEECSFNFNVCIHPLIELFENYFKNKGIIKEITTRCCLYNEKSPTARVYDSFAACARIKCGAALWG